MSVAELPAAVRVVAPLPPAQPIPKIDPYVDAPPDVSFEVVDGVRVEKPMSLVEQMMAGWLFGRLEPYCRENGIGHAAIETTFAIPGSGNDRKPDVAFVSYRTWPRTRPIPRVNAWRAVPELAVEIVSPTDRAFDVLDKVAEYFAGGVQTVWLVYSHLEQVHVFTSPTAVRILTRADDLTGDPIIPGFRLPLADLFPPPAPEPAAEAS